MIYEPELTRLSYLVVSLVCAPSRYEQLINIVLDHGCPPNLEEAVKALQNGFELLPDYSDREIYDLAISLTKNKSDNIVIAGRCLATAVRQKPVKKPGH